MLAAKLDIVSPGPGYIHFPLNEGCGFDEEFFRQLLSERREKRMRNGVMSIRWVQVRERNEALDLVCMILCCALTYRGAIDTMAAQVVTADAPQRACAASGNTGDSEPIRLSARQRASGCAVGCPVSGYSPGARSGATAHLGGTTRLRRNLVKLYGPSKHRCETKGGRIS
jgi:hypothetical protein